MKKMILKISIGALMLCGFMFTQGFSGPCNDNCLDSGDGCWCGGRWYPSYLEVE